MVGRVISVGLCLFTAVMNADNINVQNSGVINNYGTMNNIQNNYELEKANADVKINQLAGSLASNPKHRDTQTLSAVLEGAKKANQFNIALPEKKEKCVEYSLAIKFWKVDAKLARNECEKIFSK